MGSGVSVIDKFDTHNEFYGGQVGARVQYLWNRFTFDATGLLALGGTHESVNVNGSTNVYPTNAPPVSYPGGNYATLQLGHYDVNRFAFAPEMRFNFGYQIHAGHPRHHRLRLHVPQQRAPAGQSDRQHLRRRQQPVRSHEVLRLLGTGPDPERAL